MKSTVIDFVAKEVSENSSNVQTGDNLFIIVGILLFLLSGILAYFNYRKIYANNLATISLNFISVNVSKLLKILFVFVISCAIGVAIFGMNQLAYADQYKQDYSTDLHVNAYVDTNTGEVTFDKITINNTSESVIELNSLFVSKCADVNDGNCIWSFTYDNNVLYNDVANGAEHIVENPMIMKPNKNYDIQIDSAISPDIAISLIGKSVLSITYNVKPAIIKSKLSYGEGIVNVVDELGNDVADGSIIEEGTKLYATLTEFSSSNYAFHISSEAGVFVKEYEMGDIASFNMPPSDTEISGKVSENEFYALLDNTGLLSFYFDNNFNSRSLNNDIVKSYAQNTFNFNQHDYERNWPYKYEVYDVTSVTMDYSVKNFYGFKSTGGMFDDFKYAKSFNGFEYLQTENVTEMYCMFNGAGAEVDMKNVPNVSNWDTSKVTNIFMMFRAYAYNNNAQTSNFNLVPDVSKWDTSNVINMSCVFFDYAGNCKNIKVVPDVFKWNTSKVEDMSYMFYEYGCASLDFDAVPNVSKWNTSSVTNISHMFRSYAYYSQKINCVPDVSAWDTKNATNIAYMFEGYAKNSEVISVMPDLSKWNTKKLQFSEYLFLGYASGIDYSFTNWDLSLDLSSFDTTSLNYWDAMLCSTRVGTIKLGKDWKLSMGWVLYDATWTVNGEVSFDNIEDLDAYIQSYTGPYPLVLTHNDEVLLNN